MASNKIKLADITLSPNVKAVPQEDIVPGMTVNAVQRIDIDLEKIEELAFSGLSINGISAMAKLPRDTLEFHCSKTIAQGRARKALSLLEMLGQKAQDTMTVYDSSAIDKLLRRVDPEPKDPPVVIAQQFNLPAGLETLNVDDINNLLMNKS